jgi:transposase-like protein
MVMTISPGFTLTEIREFVHEYQLQSYGLKTEWLAARGVKYSVMRRWRDAVFEGDLDRGLIPREGSPMTTSENKRTALERLRALEREEHAAEVAQLSAQVRRLEETKTALGKAIGLLHALSEEEPGTSPTPTDRSDS